MYIYVYICGCTLFVHYENLHMKYSEIDFTEKHLLYLHIENSFLFSTKQYMYVR